jgi:Chaperone of endosialidase
MSAIYPNPFVLNIIDLQNVITNAGGTSGAAQIQSQITELKGMIDTTTHTVRADVLRDFSGTGGITVEADLNMGVNAVTGVQAVVNGAASGGTITNGSNSVVVGGGVDVLTAAGSNGTVFTVTDDGTVTATGAFYGTGFYTLSDQEKKGGVERLEVEGSVERLCRLEPARWEWREGVGGKGIGLIAQEVAAVFPELVVRGPTGSEHIDTMGLLAQIICAIKELRRG